MRLYKFFKTNYAMLAIREKRLKISTVSDLNDPFELLPMSLEIQSDRKAFKSAKDKFAKDRGMLCFSERWSNPVVWSNYADKHKGMCLGFDVKDGIASKVVYKEDRIVWNNPTKKSDINSFFKDVVVTKYKYWCYEEEWRIFCTLQEEEFGLYYTGLGDDLQLKEIIFGPLFDNNNINPVIRVALNNFGPNITYTIARLANKKFKVVEHKRKTKDVRQLILK